MSGNTQPTQTPANGDTQQGAPAQQNPNEGVQARINELTAQIHGHKEVVGQQSSIIQELIAQNNKLVEEMRAGRQPNQQPSLPPIPEGTDPSLVDAIAARVQAPLMQQIQQLTTQLQTTIGGVSQNQELMQMQQATAGLPSPVAAKAMDLYREAKQRNYGGWTPQNLVWMAKGMMGDQMPPPRANGNDAVTPGGGGGVAPVAPTQRELPPAKSEAELRQMTSEQRIAYYESRVGDSPIEY